MCYLGLQVASNTITSLTYEANGEKLKKNKDDGKANDHDRSQSRPLVRHKVFENIRARTATEYPIPRNCSGVEREEDHTITQQ